MTILVTILALVVIAYVWHSLLVQAKNEKFISHLVDRYRMNDASNAGKNVKCKYAGIAWRESGKKVARFSGVSKVGIGESHLIIRQPIGAKAIIPDIAIPKNDLTFVRTEFVWSALRRFDVYTVRATDSGQLLLPVSLVARG